MNVSSITFKYENKFKVGQKITLLAQIKANTGTNAKIIWVDKNGNKIIEKKMINLKMKVLFM